ncbi:Uu.00g026620.m01.CDS01 [Anthostomella pinea]|uniref:Palmitoyltransferase PFA4 n=1 Tax=Anthostomella pinea TaxID=933095 RepID=A0AAI8V7F5_9PEZI|nr:Uu.00g026620.m01.CDS01 [Anthostomella pinea]
MAFLVGSTAPALQRLAVPAVSLLIAVLGYGSQYLFAHAPDLAPGPLTRTETYLFNGLLCFLWYTYYKACTVDPGRYVFPPSRIPKKTDAAVDDPFRDPHDDASAPNNIASMMDGGRKRWCKKCAAPKPPRAHHCKTCRRCIPKMDHHCPWTSNCVSLQTFPHFLRFLAYTNLSLWALLRLLGQRFGALWAARHTPAYLGPTLNQLVALTTLGFAAGVTALALGVLLGATLKGWLFNTTMIEGWEIERHEAVLERRGGYGSRYGDDGGFWRAGDGDRDPDTSPRLMADPVEFPYDVGVFANMALAMGTRNPLLWLVPFAGGPRVAPLRADTATGTDDGVLNSSEEGWSYEENGLNDREGMWPPADPDKVRNARLWRDRKRELDAENARYLHVSNNGQSSSLASPEDEKEAFRRRQERDLRRWEGTRSRILGELEEVGGDYDDYDDRERERERDYDFVDEAYGRNSAYGYMAGATRPRAGMGIVIDEGKSGWVNADGEQLGDFGVDEDAEFDDPADSGDLVELDRGLGEEEEDDEIPLAELIRRRKVRTKDWEDT